jgi:hypothetical protein
MILSVTNDPRIFLLGTVVQTNYPCVYLTAFIDPMPGLWKKNMILVKRKSKDSKKQKPCFPHDMWFADVSSNICIDKFRRELTVYIIPSLGNKAGF